MNDQQRMVLLGGTFNPPHLGHLSLACTVSRSLEDAPIIFVPSQLNPLKEQSQLIDSTHRLHLLSMLLSGTQHKIETWELEREGPSWTIDTIKQIKQIDSREITFVIGSDCLAQLHVWKDIKKLSEMIHFQVVHRSGHPPQITGQLKNILKEKSFQLVDQSIAMDPVPVSSSGIRQALSQAIVPPGLPEKLLNYIQKHHLYGWPQTKLK